MCAAHIRYYPSYRVQCIWQEGFFMELKKHITDEKTGISYVTASLFGGYEGFLDLERYLEERGRKWQTCYGCLLEQA